MSGEGEDDRSGDGLRVHAGLEEGGRGHRQYMGFSQLDSSETKTRAGGTHLETMGEGDEGEVGDDSW